MAREDIIRNDLIKYLSAEGKFLAALRQALHQHVTYIFGLIDQYHDKRRLSIQMSDEGDPRSFHLKIKPDVQELERSISDRLEKLRQDLSDAHQMVSARKERTLPFNLRILGTRGNIGRGNNFLKEN